MKLVALPLVVRLSPPRLAAPLLAMSLLVGCARTASDPEPPLGSEPTAGSEAGSTGEGEGSSMGASDTATSDAATSDASTSETSGGDAPVAVIELDHAWLDALAGAWMGPVDPTPVGAIPVFPLHYAWEPDGSLHARTDNPGGGYFDFRFYQEDGTWVFREEGQLPGGLTQSYVLHPVQREGDRVRFVTLDAPDFLGVDIEVAAGHMTMAVMLMGREHARFELDR